MLKNFISNETVTEELIKDVKETDIGKVVNCSKLNIRKEANKTAEVISIVEADSELMIFPSDTNDGWYSVRTGELINGFCMKEFVEIIYHA